MAWYDFFKFNLGEHVRHYGSLPATHSTPLLSMHMPSHTPPTILAALPLDEKVAQLTDKISTIDKVMYYDQIAVTFVVVILQGTKKAVDSSNTTFNLSMDILSFALPATITFVNGILKGVRDSAIQEKTALASHL